jgi:glycyl-tRNA synthetase beta chain
MRWASYDFKFSRPIRWIVSLLENDIVPVQLEGVSSGRESAGHRLLSPGKVKISNAHKYADELRKAYVIVDPDERRKIIEEQVQQLAESKSGVARQLKGQLLEEVVNITEWPHALAGQFSDEYLQLPDTLIETVMVHHQRYFPVERQDADHSQKVNKNNLLPWFITISNNDRKEAAPVITRGNERVLRARLADGKFFYFDDQKTKLSDRKEALKQLTFQHELGSYADKVDRLIKIAGILSKQLALESRYSVCLEETAKVSKLDLVTSLVRELPELQGYVGSWYAEQEGLPPDVVTAIASHYSPRSNDDTIPKDTVGQLASLSDKIDNLVCLFAIGKKPSGSSDPYALRRQAQGLIDILIDGLKEYPVNLTDLIDQLLHGLEPLLEHRKQGFNRHKLAADLDEFLLQRLRGKLLDLGAGREIVEAVLSSGDPFRNLPDVVVRCTAVENLFASEGGPDTVRIANRISRIISKDCVDRVEPRLFAKDAEKKLWQTFNEEVVQPWQQGHGFRAPQCMEDYQRVLHLMKVLVPVVDAFFVEVMVNDPEDKGRSQNRQAMLKQIDNYFSSIADFTKLQSLLA